MSNDKNKNNYLWGERFEGRIYSTDSEKIHKKLTKFLSKEKNQQLPEEDILAKFNKGDEELLNIEENKYSKGDNEVVDYYFWNIGQFDEAKSTTKYIIKGKKLDPMPKALNEARGLITADYQTHLEEKWVNELREKYTITVNEELLKTIK